MPSLSNFPVVEGDTLFHGRIIPRSASLHTSSNRMWIIVGSVAGVVVLGACTAMVAVLISRSRSTKKCSDGERQRVLFLGQMDFDKQGRTPSDTLELEAESQRNAMIRKSLASRSVNSFSTSNQSIPNMMTRQQRPSVRPSQGYQPVSIEAFDTSLPRATSGSGLKSHECWEVRSCSIPKAMEPVHPELPPLLEQHPLFRNRNEESDLESEDNWQSRWEPVAQCS